MVWVGCCYFIAVLLLIVACGCWLLVSLGWGVVCCRDSGVCVYTIWWCGVVGLVLYVICAVCGVWLLVCGAVGLVHSRLACFLV